MRIARLVDIGFLIHRDSVSSTGLTASLNTQLAAIQAAIWQTELAPNGGGSVTLVTNNISDAAEYQAAFNYFTTADLGQGGHFYTIVDTATDSGLHQAFATIGTGGVPGPPPGR